VPGQVLAARMVVSTHDSRAARMASISSSRRRRNRATDSTWA
jgi:hypothetical protein